MSSLFSVDEVFWVTVVPERVLINHQPFFVEFDQIVREKEKVLNQNHCCWGQKDWKGQKLFFSIFPGNSRTTSFKQKSFNPLREKGEVMDFTPSFFRLFQIIRRSIVPSWLNSAIPTCKMNSTNGIQKILISLSTKFSSRPGYLSILVKCSFLSIIFKFHYPFNHLLMSVITWHLSVARSLCSLQQRTQLLNAKAKLIHRRHVGKSVQVKSCWDQGKYDLTTLLNYRSQ